LSKCNHEGIRNLAIYCIEAAFPDSNAIWKRIIRDGIVIKKEEMTKSALLMASLILEGKIHANLGEDIYPPVYNNYKPKPAISLINFIDKYGEPDRKGKDTTERKWYYYGPLGVMIDNSETMVFSCDTVRQFMLSAIIWRSALKSFTKGFSSNPNEYTKEFPDLSNVFLKIK
jgi:hypothetical protein